MSEYSAEDRDLRNECSRVITDIKPHVNLAVVSDILESSYTLVHMNLVTKEDRKLCVRLTVRGFEIVGDELDTSDRQPAKTYELIEQLLDDISPAYRQSFSDALSQKLLALQ